MKYGKIELQGKESGYILTLNDVGELVSSSISVSGSRNQTTVFSIQTSNTSGNVYSIPGYYEIETESLSGDLEFWLEDSTLANEGHVYEISKEDVIAANYNHYKVSIKTPSNQNIGGATPFEIFKPGEPYTLVSHKGSWLTFSGTVIAKSENILNVSKTPSNSDFISVKDAVDFANTIATSTNRIRVLVYPGLYQEDQIIINQWVSLESSSSNSTVVTPTDVTQPLVIMNGLGSQISNITLSGVTSGACISYMDDNGIVAGCVLSNSLYGIHTSGYRCVATNTAFVRTDNAPTGGNEIGIFVENGGSVDGIGIRFSSVVGTIGTAVHSTGLGSSVDLRTGFSRNCLKGLVSNDSGEIVATSFSCEGYNIAFELGNVGSPTLGLYACAALDSNTSEWDIYTENNNSNIYASGCQLSTRKTSVNGANVSISSISTDVGDEGLDVIGELHVGIPERGFESVFGEGDSHVRDMIIYRAAAGVIIEENVANKFSTLGTSGSNIFSSGVSGDEFYISTDIIFEETHDYKKWSGFKYILTQPISGGEVMPEYWDGSKWQILEYLVTQSGGKYYPLGLDFGSTIGDYHLRFNQWLFEKDINVGDINEERLTWKKTTIGTGESLEPARYWVRFRVSSDLIVNPLVDQIRIHTNRTEINGDGFVEYFGEARPLGQLPWSANSLTDIVGNATNQDIYFGANIGIGLDNNALGNNEWVGFASAAPLDLDTSSALQFRIALYSSSNITGTLDYSIRWTWVKPGGAISSNSIANSNDQNISITDSTLNANTFTWFEHYLKVPSTIARRQSGFPDIISLAFENNQPSEISIVAVNVRYIKWSEGGHI